MLPNQTKATIYAAYKELERILDKDGDLPYGSSFDVSNAEITIKIPKGTTITRDAGLQNDGKIYKKATQNLYGWAILAECFKFCRMFKQHEKLRKIILLIVRRAIRNKCSTKEALISKIPEVAEQIEQLQSELNLPKRSEETPRIINRKNSKLFATITCK